MVCDDVHGSSLADASPVAGTTPKNPVAVIGIMGSPGASTPRAVVEGVALAAMT